MSEFITAPVTVTEKPKVECTACGAAYKTAPDGACFDCRIPNWTAKEAAENKHFGPGVIGKAAYEYAQLVSAETGDGMFGPALLGKLPESYLCACGCGSGAGCKNPKPVAA